MATMETGQSFAFALNKAFLEKATLKNVHVNGHQALKG